MTKNLTRVMLATLLATLFTLVSCTEKPKPPTPDSGNTGMPIKSLSVDYYGSYYTENAGTWEMKIYDKDTTKEDEPSLRYFVINLLADPSLSFSKGLPVGEYTVNQGSSDSYAPGMIVESGYALVEDNKEVRFASGTLNVSLSEGKYCIKASLTAEDDEMFEFTHYQESIVITNKTFLSTITEDMNPEINNVELVYLGDAISSSTGYWTAYIETDGLTTSESGGLIPGVSKGSSINLQFYTDGSTASPVGRYAFNFDKKPNTAESGTVENAQLDGSWIFNFDKGAMTTEAPLTDGFLEIIENADGTFSIEIEATDDNPNESEKKTIKTKYEGEITIINTIDSGDFNTSLFFLRGSQHEGSGAKDAWTIELNTKELEDSKFQNGMKVVFDIVTNAENTPIYESDLTGNYTVEKDNNLPNFIPRAKIVEYSNGIKTEIIINSGDVSILYNNTTYEYVIGLNNMIDANGTTHNSIYTGASELIEGYPADIVFNHEGSDVSAEFYGNFEGYNNWFVYLQDKGAINQESTRLAVSLDFLLDKSLTFENRIPDGRYDFVGDEIKVGLTSTQDFTNYFGAIDNQPYDYALISGYTDIQLVEGDTYNLTLNFTNEYGRKLSASFETVISFTDYTSQTDEPSKRSIK